jgi:hypothetical protein
VRVVYNISLLIAPSIEILAICSAKHFKILIESTNKGWSNSIPITLTRPQPDYSVGFRQTTFTEDQLKKLLLFVGGLLEKSYFIATYYIYLLFLMYKVKCSAVALNIAD